MKSTKKVPVVGDGTWAAVIPFALITSCFALWGFANDITTPLVKAFSKIFRMSVTEGTLVQVAFYGGYFAMAFPAAMFIRRYSYKAGVMLGLGLYALGAFMFFPAKMTGEYYPFLLSYFILTCGLSFLETSCNPYILSMGPEETATRRLNLAQAFNPMGALLGMYVAMEFIQRRLHPLDTSERALLSDSEFEAVRDADLATLIAPYLVIGLVTLSVLILVRVMKFGRGVEARAVHLQPRVGLAVDVDALPVVHVDAEGGQLAFEHCAVAVDAVVHVQQVGIAGIGDGAHFGAFAFLVVQFDVGPCAGRVFTRCALVRQRDAEGGAPFGRDVGHEGQFVGAEVAVEVVDLRGDFLSVAGDGGRAHVQSGGVGLQVHHHGAGLARHVRGVGEPHFPHDVAGLQCRSAGHACQQQG